jgi:hypothetical protein
VFRAVVLCSRGFVDWILRVYWKYLLSGLLMREAHGEVNNGFYLHCA